MQSPEGDSLSPADFSRGELQVRQAAQQCVDGDLRFHSRQRGAEAEVTAAAEREVLIVVAADVETVGIGKDGGITIGGGDGGEDDVAALERLSAELEIFAGDAAGPLHG